MRTYLHWLDGEYLNTIARYGPNKHPTDFATGLLKLHALLGTNVVLSDVQLVDSPAVLDLFADAGFRAYLQSDPDFLHLTVRSDRREKSRFKLVTLGLQRAGAKQWKSSAFSNTEAFQKLASAILGCKEDSFSHGRTHPKLEAVISEWNKYARREDMLRRTQGILQGIRYFCQITPPSVVRDPVSTYYDVLRMVAMKKNVTDEHKGYIDQTVTFIKRHVKNPEDRGRRSVVHRFLNTKKWPHQHRVVWHTITQAWNCAVQQTLAPEGGSVGALPDSPPLGLYIDTPCDALIPFEVRKGDPAPARFTRHQRVAFEEWDPRSISWWQVRSAVLETGDTRAAFQAALRTQDQDAIESAIDSHARRLASAIAKKRSPAIGPELTPWVLVVGGVAVLMGHLAQELLTLAMESPVVSEGFTKLLRQGSRFVIADTIAGAAQRLVGPPRP